jgi:hypothetical protein
MGISFMDNGEEWASQGRADDTAASEGFQEIGLVHADVMARGGWKLGKRKSKVWES